MTTNLWVISPCYKDVSSFKKLREDIYVSLKNHNLKLSTAFILIDDTAGCDPQISELKQYEDVQVITPPFNLGHQRAIVYALRSIMDGVQPEDIIVTMDSDGEDQPADLPRLIKNLAEDFEFPQMVLAKRTRRQVSWKFKLLYACYVIMFKILTGQILRSGNFAVYRGFIAKRIVDHPFFDLCYSSALVNLRVPITYVPCMRGKRYYDVSKMGYFNLLVHGFKMLMPFIDRIAVRVIIACGFIVTGSLLMALALYSIKTFNNIEVSNWLLISLMGISFITLVVASTFLLMFTIFSQSQSIVLSKLETKTWKILNNTSNTKKVS